MKVLSLFDYSGIMVQPWLDYGYECWIIDIQHEQGITRDENLCRVSTDLMNPKAIPIDLSSVGIIFAFPPCDHLAVSGARWFKGKGLRKLAESINLFATAAEICEQTGSPYMIENPVSTISTYWRKPDHIFNPHDFTGYEATDNYTKKTCLWIGGGFVIPETKKDPNLGSPDSRIHLHSQNKERKSNRSKTPLGFAKAVFHANRHLVPLNT